LLLCFSRNSVETHCRCGGKYDTDLVANLTPSLTVKENFKIDQQFSKLWMNIEWHAFYGSWCMHWKLFAVAFTAEKLC